MIHLIERFRAVVDWLELEIHVGRKTHLRVLRELGIPYVEPLNAGDGGAADHFRFRLQEPGSGREVDALLAEIHGNLRLVGPPAVTGLELALDAYPKCTEDLPRIAADLYRFHTATASDNQRFSGIRNDPGTKPEGISSLNLVRRLAAGRVIAVGNVGDDLSQRIYVKRTDGNGRIQLPPSLHRARIENTYRGCRLPHECLSALSSFRFERLSSDFRFRKVRTDLSPIMGAVAGKINQLGQRKHRRQRTGGVRLYSKLTVADVDLNQRAYDALRELSRRWASGSSMRQSITGGAGYTGSPY